MTRGTFIPASNFANAAGIPSVPVNPFSPFNTTGVPAISPFFSLNNPAFTGMNPYFASAPFAPFAATNPYMTNPYIGGGNYGSSYGNYGPPGAYQNPQASVSNYNNAPASSNVPAYSPAQQPQSDNGGIAWPLAFRLMSPEKRRELREPAETQLAAAVAQAAAGQVNPQLVDEARLSVARLRQWLRSRRADLAEGTYADAVRFLQRADDALDGMTRAQ
jgi:ribosomal protein L29